MLPNDFKATAKVYVTELREFWTERMGKLGVNKRQLAELMGVSRIWVYGIFSNKGNLSLETIAKVNLALGIEYSFKPNV